MDGKAGCKGGCKESLLCSKSVSWLQDGARLSINARTNIFVSMCPRRKSLKDIAKEMAKLRHNESIAYVTQTFGDRQNILWRSLDDLMAVATQSFDDRQKIYGIEFSVFNWGSLWSKGWGSGWMWMLGDFESYYSMRIWVQTYVCAHAHGGVCMYNIRSFALSTALKCEYVLKS